FLTFKNCGEGFQFSEMGVTDSSSDSGESPPPPPPPGTMPSDFTTRCAADGVLLCNGFDSETDIALGCGSIQLAADNTRQGFIDTTQSASGDGSLRFTLRGGV